MVGPLVAPSPVVPLVPQPVVLPPPVVPQELVLVRPPQELALLVELVLPLLLVQPFPRSSSLELLVVAVDLLAALPLVVPQPVELPLRLVVLAQATLTVRAGKTTPVRLSKVAETNSRTPPYRHSARKNVGAVKKRKKNVAASWPRC